MVARTICSRRSGPIPSLGVTPVFVSPKFILVGRPIMLRQKYAPETAGGSSGRRSDGATCARTPRSASEASTLRGPLGLEPSAFRARVVGMTHGGRERPVPGLLGDQAGHGLADPARRGVPLRRGTQPDHVHGLAP